MKTDDRLSAWVRRRALASDRRAGMFSRSIAVARQREWIRRNCRVLGLEALFVLVVLVPMFWMPRQVRGFAVGAWLATGAWLIVSQVVLASGTAPQIMGERGEQFTASELRRLQRRGWRVINHVLLKSRQDIDHIAVGPDGVLVIETKWSGEPWVLGGATQERVRSAVSRVAADAVVIRRMFPNDVRAPSVVPLVVLWGGYNGDDLDTRVVDGVTVVRGSALRELISALKAEVALTADQQDRVWNTLARHVEQRDAHDLAREGPALRTPGEMIRNGVELLCTFWLGVVLPGLTLRFGFSIFALAEVVAGITGALAFRYVRGISVAWLTGVAAIGLLVALAGLVDHL